MRVMKNTWLENLSGRFLENITNMLKDKVIIVSGGAGLLGKEFVKAILENNGIAVIADILQENAEKVKAELTLRFNPDRIKTAVVDITSEGAVKTLISNTEKEFGRIDGLVNNAYPRSQSYGQKLEKVSYTDFCSNVDLHLGGYFLMMKEFAEYFKIKKSGSVINMSSIYGVMAPRFEVYEGTEMTMPVEYAAIKSAIIRLTEYFAKYYKGSGVRFNCISPGGIFNNQDESFLKKYAEFSLSKGMLDPKDICGTLIFLLSDMSRYLNGQNIIVDDGFSL
jgi:NAD(P)-dependent dehydrogenase (short-subunit alcohol dehydrogenase family)